MHGALHCPLMCMGEALEFKNFLKGIFKNISVLAQKTFLLKKHIIGKDLAGNPPFQCKVHVLHGVI